MTSLRISLTLVVVVTIAKVAGGIVSGSLALLADAGYGLTVGVAMGLALLTTGSDAPAGTVQRTFGYQRAEILASLANALVLWAIAAWILLEAWGRFGEGSDVDGGLMLGIAVIGLAVHVIVMLVLKQPAEEHAGVAHMKEHTFLSVMGPAATVLGALAIQILDWQAADLTFAAAIAILALVNTWRLLAHVVHVLLEGTPEHIDVYRLCSRIEELPGVTLIHDVHVWTLTPGYDALTAHVMVEPERRREMQDLLGRIRTIAYEEFDIRHVTVQLETTAANCMEDHHVDHLVAHARPA